MKVVNKNGNKGNTFIGLVMTAFELKSQLDVVVCPEWQYGNCGTVEVLGVLYDWRDSGDKVTFVLAV